MKPEYNPLNNDHQVPNGTADFCPQCGSPAELEALLKGQEAGGEARRRWQAHLAVSPACRQDARQDAELRGIFAQLQADPVLTELSRHWRFDLRAGLDGPASRRGERLTPPDLDFSLLAPLAIRPGGRKGSKWRWSLVAGLALSVAATLLILLLVTNQSTSPDPALTPANRTAPTVKVPVSKVYLGPDNAFHSDPLGTGLVGTGPTSLLTNLSNFSFHLNWLVSDPDGTFVGLTITNNNPDGSESFPLEYYSDRQASLTDEYNRVYNLNVAQFSPAAGTNRTPYYMVMQGPALPGGTRQVSFSSKSGLAFNLPGAISLRLQNFQEAGLPQALAWPALAAEAKGIKLRVPYAYLGPDRSVLAVEIVSSSLAGSAAEYTLDQAGLDVRDDLGQRLGPLSIPTGQADWARFSDRPNGAVYNFQPVRPGAKSLNIRLDSLDVKAHTAGATQAGSFVIPLGELLKSGSLEPGRGPGGGQAEIDNGDFTLELVEQQATLDRASGKINLNLAIKYTPRPGLQGAVIQGLSYRCIGCGQSTDMMNRPEAGRLVVRTQLTINYNLALAQPSAEIKLGGFGANYNLPGPWQLKALLKDEG